jgi:hypothetical protein
MENLLKAIHGALTNNPEVTELIPAERIRRGWNEPVDCPTIRFASTGVKPIGDDLSNSQILDETILITVIANSDLEMEPIASEIIKAMKAESIIDSQIEIHSLNFVGDGRGTFFDPLRKRHRKDLSFSIIYSPLE